MAVIPSSGKSRNAMSVLRRVISAAWWGEDVSTIDPAPIALFNEPVLAVNEAGTGYVELLRAGPGNTVQVGGTTVTPFYKTVMFSSRFVGTGSGRRFWIADSNYTVVGIQEIHGTAETTAATLTANIQKIRFRDAIP